MTTQDAKIQLSRFEWFTFTRELCRRGRNRRESGAFLLACDGSPQIRRIVYYDDLDPCCLNCGYINFDGSGYVKLWNICGEKSLRVVADVHTHPTRWTGQSLSDEENPMIAQRGHLAMIIPNYARGVRFTLRGVGVYEYLGDGAWRKWPTNSGIVRITNL